MAMQLDGDSCSSGANSVAESIANDFSVRTGFGMPQTARGERRSGFRVAVVIADPDFIVWAPVFGFVEANRGVTLRPADTPVTNCSAPTQLRCWRSSGVRNRWRALGSWSRAQQGLPDRTRWNVALYIVVPVLRRPAPVHPCGVGTFRSPSRTVCGLRTRQFHKRSTCQGIWSRPRVIFTISRFGAAT